MATTPNCPSSAGTVVIGAGIVGCNLAYQLTELGHNDVAVNQGSMPTTGGSSTHTPGIMFQNVHSAEYG